MISENNNIGLVDGVGRFSVDEVRNVGEDGYKYTRLRGGFGEGQPVITDLQVAELLGYSKGARQVRVQLENNKKYFTTDDVIDFKSSVQDRDSMMSVLIPMGYSRQSIDLSKNIYGFSKAGFILYLKFAEGDKAVELYKSFIESYFRQEAKVEELEDNVETLEDAIKFEIEELKNEKANAIGRMFVSDDESDRLDLMRRIENINDRIAKLVSKLDNMDIDIALQEQTKLTNSKREYMNQRDFGSQFNLKMGSKTVGKLLRLVGLAMKSVNKTTPYEASCPKYAQSILNQQTGVVSYKWNYNECIVVIDKWLKENNHYERFYEITDKETMIKFINALCEIHIS